MLKASWSWTTIHCLKQVKRFIESKTDLRNERYRISVKMKWFTDSNTNFVFVIDSNKQRDLLIHVLTCWMRENESSSWLKDSSTEALTWRVRGDRISVTTERFAYLNTDSFRKRGVNLCCDGKNSLICWMTEENPSHDRRIDWFKHSSATANDGKDLMTWGARIRFSVHSNGLRSCRHEAKLVAVRVQLVSKPQHKISTFRHQKYQSN